MPDEKSQQFDDGDDGARGKIVTVHTCSDSTELIMAKMLLEASSIPFITKGEGVQDLFGAGRMFGGFNLVTGPVEIQVAESDAERAAEVLEEIG